LAVSRRHLSPNYPYFGMGETSGGYRGTSRQAYEQAVEVPGPVTEAVERPRKLWYGSGSRC